MAVQKKEKFHFNIGIITFILIFIYILGHVVIFMGREELAVYEVIQSQIYDSIETSGLILRDEVLVEAERAGYVNYYVNEGELVSKNGLVYSSDETGEVQKYISNLVEQEQTFSSSDYDDIRGELKDFEEKYSDSQFDYVYDLKYNLENKALRLGESIMEAHKDEIDSKIGSNKFVKYYSKDHGMITYLKDGYEGRKVSEITEEDFKIANYQKEDLKTTDKVKKGDEIYRLIKSQDWKIVLLLNKEEYTKMKEKTRVNVELGGGEVSLTCPVSFETCGDNYLAVLTMKDYLVQFCKERFVKVEVLLNSEEGLKIPNSSIDMKPFYKIPKGYFTGKIAANKTLILKKQDKKGNVTFESVNVDIGKYIEEEDGKAYYYVLTEELPENALISMPDSSETMLLKETVELPGVYNINRGYADFRCISVLMENEDYTIVKADVSNSIALFDRIVLNGDTIENNEIIY